MKPYLIIYDNTGKIWGIYDGETEAPPGLQSVIAMLPDNFSNVWIDLDTLEVHYDTFPDMQQMINDLNNAVVELYEIMAGGAV